MLVINFVCGIHVSVLTNQYDRFFSSVLQAMENDPRWCHDVDVKAHLGEFKAVLLMWDKLKNTKKMPKFNSKADRVTWLREVNRKAGNSALPGDTLQQ